MTKVCYCSATVFFNHWHLNADKCVCVYVCVLWLLFRMKYKWNILFPAFEYFSSLCSRRISSQQCCEVPLNRSHNVTDIMNFLVWLPFLLLLHRTQYLHYLFTIWNMYNNNNSKVCTYARIKWHFLFISFVWMEPVVAIVVFCFK